MLRILSNLRFFVMFAAILPGITLFASLAIAQDDPPESNDVTDVIDEVVVVGPRSLGSLRHEIARADDKIYSIFNVLNEDDGYDIICKKEMKRGSKIVYRVCKARMFREAVAEAAEDSLDEDTAGGYVSLNEAKHEKILHEKMLALAVENPELLEALKERLVLKKQFDEEKERRRK